MDRCFCCGSEIDIDEDSDLNYLIVSLEYLKNPITKFSADINLNYCANCYEYPQLKAQWLLESISHSLRKSKEQLEPKKKRKSTKKKSE